MESTNSQSADVIIVGAGLAGLAAAYQLARSGVRVLMLEARDRTGGRVWTLHDWEYGQYADAGGEFVDSNHRHVIRYASRFRVPLLTKRQKWFFHPQDGRMTPLNEEAWLRFWRSLHHLSPKIRSIRKPWRIAQPLHELDDISLPEWAERLGLWNELRHWILLYCRNMEAAEPEQTSVLGAIAEERLYQNGLSVLEESAKLEGGSQRLADRFTEHFKVLGGHLRLGAVVEEVRHDSEGVQVYYRHGSQTDSARCKRLIFAVPNTLLKQIRIFPALSHEKEDAIRLTPYGHAVKNLLQFRQRFWQTSIPQDIFRHDSISALWDLTDTQEGEAGILCCWVGGKPAQEWAGRPEPERIENCLQAVEKVFPGSRELFVKGRSIAWEKDLFAQSSYSFYSIGSLTRIMPFLAVPEGRLHFAGEHTSPFIGYMEGALESGMRAAREVLRLRQRD